MTESEWLASTDPAAMLDYLRLPPRGRKLKLFGAACCRRVWHLLVDEWSRTAVEVAGKARGDFIGREGQVTVIRDARQACTTASVRVLFEDPSVFAARAAYHAAGGGRDSIRHSALNAAFAVAVEDGCRDPRELGSNPRYLAERSAQSAVLREIFGNPFRPSPLEPSWLTPAVASLASAAYEELVLPAGTLDAARLAVLADAFEEAGCDAADILGHCRSAGPHVRGCWVVDLLLGKE